MPEKIYSVSEINNEINEALKRHSQLLKCWVTGEISNFKEHIPSGHWYFTIKDENAGIKVVMFKTKANIAGFKPQNGMKVIILGNIRLYQKDGSVQLYADEIYPSGVGTLYLAFEQLKNKLVIEGLFASDKKKSIPRYPSKVAIVTSLSGAALKDILNIARRRNPKISLIIVPSAVQGDAAPGEIAKAIRKINNRSDIDVIIVGRGGGSLEELWAFNTEVVARAIAKSHIPIISAVGHEIDFSIADFAADLRAPTPSAAAELAIPLLDEIQACISNYEEKLNLRMKNLLERKRRRVEELMSDRALVRTIWRLEQSRQDLDTITSRLQECVTGFIADRDGILKLLCAKLDLLSPINTLTRGYTLAYKRDGKLLVSINQVSEGDGLVLQLSDGAVDCEVKRVNER